MFVGGFLAFLLDNTIPGIYTIPGLNTLGQITRFEYILSEKSWHILYREQTSAHFDALLLFIY